MLSAEVVTINRSNIAHTFTDPLGNITGMLLDELVPGALVTKKGKVFLPVWDVSGECNEVLEINTRDPRDNIKRLWDTSKAPDPIGIEGIGWVERQLGGLDRIVVEGCYQGFKISNPRLNFEDKTPGHLRPENIQSRIGRVNGKKSPFICSLADAETLCSAWRSLEITPQIATKLINRIRKSHKVLDAIASCTTWAAALDAVTVHPDEFIPGEAELWEARDSDEPMTEDEALMNEWPDESATAHDAFQWTPVGITEYDWSEDWLDIQPGWYTYLIKRVQAITDFQELADLKESRFRNKSTGNWPQSALFWWVCAIQERKLESRVRPNLKRLLKWLKHTNRPQGWLGTYIFNLKKKVALSNRQWSVVWALWKAKGAARGQQPSRPEPPPIDEFSCPVEPEEQYVLEFPSA